MLRCRGSLDDPGGPRVTTGPFEGTEEVAGGEVREEVTKEQSSQERRATSPGTWRLRKLEKAGHGCSPEPAGGPHPAPL